MDQNKRALLRQEAVGRVELYERMNALTVKLRLHGFADPDPNPIWSIEAKRLIFAIDRNLDFDYDDLSGELSWSDDNEILFRLTVL
ncbi:hypothetical protein OKW76_07150 [Sphingomonas sp. S1-29]|uniref:hypothetical protein n=1 Tax=Sphingomonas sp. S1-29 TaxID=2991074 RepID=UPI00223EDDD0|nr:hypothetical protein [Sphingomonas sp. S1-29]UZK70792.1 hypothetical protein OKW76_07150 [Sphingomonas sp. S1-29]